MLFLINRLSIKAKLLLILLSISVLSALAVGYLGYINGKQIITNGISDQLTSLRTTKAHQISSYFIYINNLIETLSEDEMVVNAMRSFKTAYHQLQQDTITGEQEQKLQEYYADYVHRLSQNLNVRPNTNHYLPPANKSKYLQYHYIANNEHPVGQKHLLEQGSDTSSYHTVHKKYHLTFNQLSQRFGFHDVFFIDNDSGDIIYTTYKEADYATNLYHGPYRESNLADLVRTINRDKDIQKGRLIDFRRYRPSYATPAAFIATPVYDHFEMIGILAFQLPIDEINNIMTDHQHWREDGLGHTGEVYLVGAEDLLMRSVSRFLLEDKEKYEQTQANLGTNKEQLHKMLQLNTTILQQKVNTKASQEIAKDNSGTSIVESYQGKPVLSSYAPLSIAGLDWGIIAEKELAEAYQPLYDFERKLLTYLVVIVLLITFISVFIAILFIRPLHQLQSVAHLVANGKTDVSVDISTQDEFGDLAHAFNHMIKNIQEKKVLIEESEKEKERLLLNILPKPVVKRLQNEEAYIGEEFSNVSLLIANIVGFEHFTDKMTPHEEIHLLNQLIDSFDVIAEQCGVEKIKSLGAGYMATCGLSEPRLDHSKRMVDFAIAFKKHLQHFNHQHQANLSVRMGISSGSVTAGIIGKKKFVYDLWGNAVQVAQRIQATGFENEIQVPHHVYMHLNGMYNFEALSTIDAPNQDAMQIWAIRK